MEEKNKRKIIAIVLTVFAIVAVIGTTYAFISRTLTGTKKVTLTAGILSLVLDEKNEITISDALPMYDQVGMIQEEVFEFDLINETSNPTDYVLKLQKVSTGNELSEDDVKYYLTKDGVGKPALLSTLTDGVVDSGTIEGNDTIEYTLRLWISDKVTEKTAIEGKSLSYKLAVEAKQKIEWAADFGEDTSGANIPQLTSGMIPVVYNESDKVWVKADSTNQEKYYNYDNQIWANAVTVTEETRDTYMLMDAGEPISMDDINTMWVWIPRYEYDTTGLGTIVATGEDIGELKVNFISSSTTTPSDSTKYQIPEGFKFGEENIPGFWMGKFTTSSLESCVAANDSIDTGCDLTTLTPQVKPNVTSWRGARVSTFFEASRLMQSEDNASIYGFDVEGTSSMDTHMLKNTEWGIVAMLSQSKYGKFGNSNYKGDDIEIYHNWSSDYITGMSNGQRIKLGKSKTQVTYDTPITGYGASTTGTIYGVYDMGNGNYTYLMATYSDITGTAYSSSEESGFCTINKSTDGTCRELPNEKYYDLYIEFEMSKGYKYGDATYETTRWNNDGISSQLYGGYGQWFSRNTPTAGNLTDNGVFSYRVDEGAANSMSSSRLAIKP